MEIDRAIATAVGGPAGEVFRELGRHSASLNLGGVYRSFVAEEPHRFFEQTALLHGRFQTFGRSAYEKPSSTSRTRWASPSGVNGFCRKAAPSSRGWIS